MMPIEEVRTLLEKNFPGDIVRLTDPRGDSKHFHCVVVSGKFSGKTPVQQHQMVYQALGEAMNEAIHALAIRTYTPEQWRQQQSAYPDNADS